MPRSLALIEHHPLNKRKHGSRAGLHKSKRENTFMPRTTNADRILNDSAMRLEAARMREALAQSQLNTAKAVLEALQKAHETLERELTPKPRKKQERSAPAQKDPQ